MNVGVPVSASYGRDLAIPGLGRCRARPCRSALSVTERAPVLKLSVRLIDTYNHINQVYYEAKRRKPTARECEGDLHPRRGCYPEGGTGCRR